VEKRQNSCRKAVTLSPPVPNVILTHHGLYADGTQVERSENQRRCVVNRYADCTYCGGEVVEEYIDYDYRREKRLMVVSNVPVGVCRQCGEKYFKPDVLKRMDSLYHGIFERNEKPDRTLSVPEVSL
jgi:YgiT-type zinc finger domain-containing protein